MILLFTLLCSISFGCSSMQPTLMWRARELLLVPEPVVDLQRPNGEIAGSISTRTIQRLMLAHLRITRSANIQAELIIYDGEQPNALAALADGRRIIGVNMAMVKLIGDDIDAFAALLGHETAHWARGHVGSTRSTTIQAIGTALGVGLGAAGVPGAGYISGFGADLVDAAYSRDDEREADAFAIDYMIANSFDPEGAIRLHEKLLKQNTRIRIPFLSSHPSNEERIDNLRKLIDEKTRSSR
jgi:Zn-dependent protease with chaperone function